MNLLQIIALIAVAIGAVVGWCSNKLEGVAYQVKEGLLAALFMFTFMLILAAIFGALP